MRISQHRKYIKEYLKLPEEDRLATKAALVKFEADPFDPSLRNHALKGPLAGLRSIDAKGDLRILFTENSQGRYELVTLLRVGSHAKLYKK